MTVFPGFTLPEELRLLARADPPVRPGRDHPARADHRPGRARHPARGLPAPRRQDQGGRACGRWARPRSTAAAGSTRSACASCSRRWRSTAWASTTRAAASSAATRRPRSGGEQGADREVRGARAARRQRDVLRDHRALGRLGPRRRHPDARRAPRRPVGPQRPQGLHLPRPRRAVGHRLRAHRQGQGPRGHLVLHPGEGHPGLHAEADPDDPHRRRSPTTCASRTARSRPRT